jgi:hypothetical protein
VLTAIALLCAPCSGNAQSESATPPLAKRCDFTKPSYSVAAGNAKFGVTISCGSSAKPVFPINADVLIGLTVYRLPDKPVRRGSIDPARLKGPAGEKWALLIDEQSDSFDFPIQAVRIGSNTSTKTLTFETPLQSIDGMSHFLFAAWRPDARQACDKRSDPRPGCRAYGYVMGDGYGVPVIAAYPALVTDEGYDDDDHEIRTEKWVVEPFR